MKNLSVAILLFCIITPTGVSQQIPKAKPEINEKVLEVYYNHGGGEPGGSTGLHVKPESTSYSFKWYGLPSIELNIKTNTSEWNKLVSQVNLAEFDKIPNGPREREVDGIDTRICILTPVKIHTLIIDPNTIKRYSSANNLLTKLQYLVSQMDKRAALSK